MHMLRIPNARLKTKKRELFRKLDLLKHLNHLTSFMWSNEKRYGETGSRKYIIGFRRSPSLSLMLLGAQMAIAHPRLSHLWTTKSSWSSALVIIGYETVSLYVEGRGTGNRLLDFSFSLLWWRGSSSLKQGQQNMQAGRWGEALNNESCGYLDGFQKCSLQYCNILSIVSKRYRLLILGRWSIYTYSCFFH